MEDNSMKRRSLILIMFFVILSLIGCSSFGEEEPPGPRVTEMNEAAKKSCGDGVCDGPETTENCPADCGKAQESTSQVPPVPGNSSGTIPPLYFFYAIHVHGSKEYLPYTDPAQTAIDPQAAENMLAAIEGIAAVLDRYGAKATWEFMAPAVEGLVEYQGGPVIFEELLAKGHEIGVHGHQMDAVPQAVEALETYLGIDPVTSSGFLTQVPVTGEAQAQSAMSLVMRMTAENGLSVGTVNFTPGGEMNTISGACDNQLGTGNDMYQETGNLLFPWRPDYLNEDICSDLPDGKMTLIDHVPLTSFILPGEDGPPDVLDSQHFGQLQGYFDNALNYLEENQPERTASWGFVTHIIEYAIGSNTENPPEDSALAALDTFLAHVAAFQEQGLVIFATASEIAEQVP
jgi:hypothetical protein